MSQKLKGGIFVELFICQFLFLIFARRVNLPIKTWSFFPLKGMEAESADLSTVLEDSFHFYRTFPNLSLNPVFV